MPVVVRFTDGSERTFPNADSAHLDGHLIRVMRYNTKRRKSEDVEVIHADQVTLAEVVTGNIVTGRILGRGRVR